MRLNLQFITFCCVAFLILTSISCDNLVGHNGCSNDIADSKENGVFIKEIGAVEGLGKINDTLQIRIKSAWIENHWKYGKSYGDCIKIDGYQLIVETYPEDLEGYYQTWTVGVDGFAYFRMASQSALISDLDEIPADSSLRWQVQKGNSFSPNHEPEVIGEFRLQSR